MEPKGTELYVVQFLEGSREAYNLRTPKVKAEERTRAALGSGRVL